MEGSQPQALGVPELRKAVLLQYMCTHGGGWGCVCVCVCMRAQQLFFFNQAAKHRVPLGSQRLNIILKGWCLHMKRDG